MRKGRSGLVVGALFLASTIGLIDAGPAAHARPLAATKRADFNGDGFADLAVGAPFEDVGSATNTGAVNVIYSTSTGLASTNNVQIYQGTGGVPGTAQTGDRFGQALAAGDFNGDGFADLAIGMPGKNIGTATNAGSVVVMYGSVNRLTGTGAQVWTQGSNGLIGTSDKNDGFGAALATGDLNGDGFADLAVDADGEMVGGNAKAGAVTVIYGSPGGLTATGDQVWHQNNMGIDSAEANDRLGSVAIGDFNHDGKGDLAIGVAYEDLGANADAGEVNVLYGSASGLTATGSQLWTQDSTDVLDQVEATDGFGYSVATGDINGDGFADLAVGVPGETLGTATQAGSVNILFGSASGLVATGNQFWNQDSTGVPGTAEKDDEFGSAVALGDFNGDGKADLAAGVPFQKVGAYVYAGAVDVLPGSAAGLTATGSQEWSQDTSGVNGTAEASDFFGDPVMAQDFGKGTQTDLVIGAPGEDVGSTAEAGAANVLYGSATGLTSTANQQWYQGSGGIAGTSETRDSFSWSAAAGAGA